MAGMLPTPIEEKRGKNIKTELAKLINSDKEITKDTKILEILNETYDLNEDKIYNALEKIASLQPEEEPFEPMYPIIWIKDGKIKGWTDGKYSQGLSRPHLTVIEDDVIYDKTIYGIKRPNGEIYWICARGVKTDGLFSAIVMKVDSQEHIRTCEICDVIFELISNSPNKILGGENNSTTQEIYTYSKITINVDNDNKKIIANSGDVPVSRWPSDALFGGEFIFVPQFPLNSGEFLTSIGNRSIVLTTKRTTELTIQNGQEIGRIIPRPYYDWREGFYAVNISAYAKEDYRNLAPEHIPAPIV